MSLKSLYKISCFEVKENEFSASISFNPSHPIFAGHFPGQPVVPGICLIHIIKDIANTISDRELLLTNGSNIKFLHVIDPHKHANVQIKGTFLSEPDEGIVIKASVYSGETVFFKFKGHFNTETMEQ